MLLVKWRPSQLPQESKSFKSASHYVSHHAHGQAEALLCPRDCYLTWIIDLVDLNEAACVVLKGLDGVAVLADDTTDHALWALNSRRRLATSVSRERKGHASN